MLFKAYFECVNKLFENLEKFSDISQVIRFISESSVKRLRINDHPREAECFWSEDGEEFGTPSKTVKVLQI